MSYLAPQMKALEGKREDYDLKRAVESEKRDELANASPAQQAVEAERAQRQDDIATT